MRTRVLLLVVVSTVAIGATQAQAADTTFTVNSTADTGGQCPTVSTCTLRQAINSSQAVAGNDDIGFDLPEGSVISLGSTLIVAGNVNIVGPGVHALTVRLADAAPAGSVFAPTTGAVNFSNFTISGGHAGPGQAGGITVSGAATSFISTMSISGNTANGGGGASSAAGAIINGGQMNLIGSLVSGNSVTNAGTGQSAAIVNFGPNFMANTTITGNTVTGTGSTGDAGGVVTFNTLIANNATFAGNSSSTGAGAIVNDGGSVRLANTIVAGNTGPAGAECDGSITSQGYNLIGNSEGCTFTAGTGDLVGTAASPIDAKLNPLADNGFVTRTLLPMFGSPAVNAGNPVEPGSDDFPPAPATVACRETDQRRTQRPVDGRCDIGAVEGASAKPADPPVTPKPIVTLPKADTTKPSLSKLGLSPSSFKAKASGGSVTTKGGTKVSFTLSEAATVKFTVQRRTTGRRSGSKCVKPTKKNRSKKRCTRYVNVSGSITRAGVAGANSFRFSGRLRNKKLAVGRYRLNGVATDAAKNASKTIRKTFTVKR